MLMFDSDVSKEYLRLYRHGVLTALELDAIRLNGLKSVKQIKPVYRIEPVCRQNGKICPLRQIVENGHYISREIIRYKEVNSKKASRMKDIGWVKANTYNQVLVKMTTYGII